MDFPIVSCELPTGGKKNPKLNNTVTLPSGTLGWIKFCLLTDSFILPALTSTESREPGTKCFQDVGVLAFSLFPMRL